MSAKQHMIDLPTSINRWFRRWWQGKFVPPDPHPSLIFRGHYERHWTARATEGVWLYFKEHHRWIIGIVIVVLLAVAVKK
jgi:hypothetical protein